MTVKTTKREYPKFECKKCGKCCKGLLMRDLGILRGLTLLPKERQLFSESTVAPGLGFGKDPDDKTFRVVTYQLKLDDCPKLEDNLCMIYDNRPASCRQFPFSYDINSETGDTLLGVDLNCPAVLDLIEKSSQLYFEERSSAERILEIKRLLANKTKIAWLYDLEKMNWMPMNNQIKV